MRRFAAVLVVIVASSSASAQSDVDRENAQQLYKAGNDARDRGDVQTSLVKYKAAYEIYKTPVIGLELGKAEIALKQLIEARHTLAAVDAIARKPNESALTTSARSEASRLALALETRIPQIALKIRLAAGATRPTIAVDGAAIPEGAFDVPRKVNPGRHVIVVTSVGSQRQYDVDVREGETKDVPIDIAPPLTVGQPTETQVSPPVVTRTAAPAGPRVRVRFTEQFSSGRSVVWRRVAPDRWEVGDSHDGQVETWTVVDRSTIPRSLTTCYRGDQWLPAPQVTGEILGSGNAHLFLPDVRAGSVMLSEQPSSSLEHQFVSDPEEQRTKWCQVGTLVDVVLSPSPLSEGTMIRVEGGDVAVVSVGPLHPYEHEVK